MPFPWVAIQRNPKSGEGAKRAQILALCAGLRRLGIRPRLFSRRDRLAQALDRSGDHDAPLALVAAGGDGTVGDLVNRFPEVPLTVLPLGTENLLARTLGIPCDGRFVAEMIGQGQTRQIDVGVVNGRRFTLMMSAGFDAEVIHRLHARRRGNIRKWNYVQPILETLRSYRYPELRADVGEGDPSSKMLPGGVWKGSLVVVANLPAYAMGLPLAADAAGDDGLLDLRLFERSSAFQMVRYLYNVARRRHEGLADVRAGRFQQMRIESDVPVPLQCDGDPAGFTPADVTILRGALTLFVPGARAVPANPAGPVFPHATHQN